MKSQVVGMYVTLVITTNDSIKDTWPVRSLNTSHQTQGASRLNREPSFETEKGTKEEKNRKSRRHVVEKDAPVQVTRVDQPVGPEAALV